MNDTTEILSPADAVLALQQQLDDCDDAIGLTARTWRELAANPERAAQVAERLSTLERQREVLSAALAEAQQAQGGAAAAEAAAQRERDIEAARLQLLQLVDRRNQMARELEQAVDRVAELVRGLDEQGREFVKAAGGSLWLRHSGVRIEDLATSINAADLCSTINQILGRRLGRLWQAEEISPASRGVTVLDRIERETRPIVAAFERGGAPI
jgi:hypothetical protein